MPRARAHVIISGGVQGVFFRVHTRDRAKAVDVVGFVKNRGNDEVEAVFEGEQKDVERVVTWCHRGPPLANVDNIRVGWERPTNEFDKFSIR